MDAVSVSLLSALVAALVSLLMALLTKRVEVTKIRSELAKELFVRRLNAYPKLLAVVQNVGKEDSMNEFSKEDIVGMTKDCFDNMVKWQTETDGYLLFSKNSLHFFRELKNCIKKTIRGGIRKDGRLPYDKERLREIFVLRGNLRGALRDDIECLYEYEKRRR